jgi:pyruvate dehydrogenase E2 component (dihydrolipoamide acetyltransferase)
MSTEVLVPPLGQTVDTLTLVSWYKNEGEAVTAGEPLYAVETDKATLDVEAPASGVLCGVTAQPGDVVKVLSAIASIEVKVKVEAEPILALTSALTSTSPSRLFISPRARRLAEGEGVDLGEIKATGPEGAIVERDVRAYADEVKAKAESERVSTSTLTSTLITPVARRMAEEAGLDWQAIAGTGPRGQITREDVEAALEQRSGGAEGQRGGGAEVARQLPATTPAEQAVQLPTVDVGERIPLKGVRAIIAERMVAGHSQTAPVTLTSEADATALVELRQKLAADGVAVSYNDLFLAILAKALGEHPRLNAALDGDTVKLWPQMDIAVAVDTERGLLAPVVRGVDRKGLAQLAVETASLAERARAGKSAPDELTGSTFTLTNLGMFGIDAFTPIINLPECAILGVGRIKTQPVWIGDHVEPRQMVWLSLTFDHRLVDGGPAARFLQRVAQLLEKPHLLMA